MVIDKNGWDLVPSFVDKLSAELGISISSGSTIAIGDMLKDLIEDLPPKDAEKDALEESYAAGYAEGYAVGEDKGHEAAYKEGLQNAR